jgi:hypothetical protein
LEVQEYSNTVNEGEPREQLEPDLKGEELEESVDYHSSLSLGFFEACLDHEVEHTPHKKKDGFKEQQGERNDKEVVSVEVELSLFFSDLQVSQSSVATTGKPFTLSKVESSKDCRSSSSVSSVCG